MKKIKRWISEVFEPSNFNDLDTTPILEALNDASVRKEWVLEVFEMLKNVNLEVDKRLLAGTESGYIDLCARRKAIQDILLMVSSAKRKVTHGTGHNPKVGEVIVNLDKTTA